MAKIKWTPQKFLKELERAASSTVAEASDLVKKDIRSSFGSSSPSAPNNPPAIVTGQLYRGVGVQKKTNLTYLVGIEPSQDIKALALEFGHSKAAPRPYLRPQRRPALKHLLVQFLKRVKFTKVRVK